MRIDGGSSNPQNLLSANDEYGPYQLPIPVQGA